MQSLKSTITQKLDQRIENNNLRKLPAENSLIDFCSNDYLGLSRSKELATLISQRFETFQAIHLNGATGSRLISGNYGHYEALEKKLAGIHHSEAALLFNSGYSANLAVLSSLPQKGDTIIYDELSHACLKDGARLSFADRFSFRHNDLEDLKKKLAKAKGNIFIVIESIYSMDGDSAPLKEIAELASQFDACVIVDEAHSTGIHGKNGAGLVVELGLQDKIGIRIHTYGKAMGCHGACVAAPQYIIDYLVNFARPFIYTTGLPLHSILTIESAYSYLEQHTELTSALKAKIALFRNNLSAELETVFSESPIQAVLVSGNDKVKQLAQKLKENGFDARPILSPTVKEGTERIRICLHSYNSDEEILGLVKLLNLS